MESSLLLITYQIRTYVTDDKETTPTGSVEAALEALVQSIEEAYSVAIKVQDSIVKRDANTMDFRFILSICGYDRAVLNARGALQRLNPSQTRSTVDGTVNVSPLDSIVSYSNHQVHIVGLPDNVDKTRRYCLALKDKLNGLDLVEIQIDLRLVTLIAGRKRILIHDIMSDTNSNIYIPSCLSIYALGLNSVDLSVPVTGTIYITGLPDAVKSAKDRLLALIKEKVFSTNSVLEFLYKTNRMHTQKTLLAIKRKTINIKEYNDR